MDEMINFLENLGIEFDISESDGSPYQIFTIYGVFDNIFVVNTKTDTIFKPDKEYKSLSFDYVKEWIKEIYDEWKEEMEN